MEIYASATAKRTYKPENVTVNLTFSVKEKTYEKSLKNGLLAVDDFVNNVLTKIGVTKEDFKTTKFTVNEETIYDSSKNKRIFDGYRFNQYSKITLDYDIKKLSLLMEQISVMENPPSYRAVFDVNDRDEKKNQVIGDAIRFSRTKAEVIALASGKQIEDIVRVDFKPFDGIGHSTQLDSRDFGAYKSAETSYMASNMIENNFTPEDIEISETVYCMFYAK